MQVRVAGDSMSNRLLNLITCNLHNRHSIASAFFYIIVFIFCLAYFVGSISLCGQIMAVGKLYMLRQFFTRLSNRIKRWIVFIFFLLCRTVSKVNLPCLFYLFYAFLYCHWSLSSSSWSSPSLSSSLSSQLSFVKIMPSISLIWYFIDQLRCGKF